MCNIFLHATSSVLGADDYSDSNDAAALLVVGLWQLTNSLIFCGLTVWCQRGSKFELIALPMVSYVMLRQLHGGTARTFSGPRARFRSSSYS